MRQRVFFSVGLGPKPKPPKILAAPDRYVARVDGDLRIVELYKTPGTNTILAIEVVTQRVYSLYRVTLIRPAHAT